MDKVTLVGISEFLLKNRDRSACTKLPIPRKYVNQRKDIKSEASSLFQMQKKAGVYLFV